MTYKEALREFKREFVQALHVECNGNRRGDIICIFDFCNLRIHK